MSEVMFGTASNLHKIPPGSSAMHVGSSIIEPVDVVRNLGVMIDAQLSMHEQVSRTAQVCFSTYIGCGLFVGSLIVMSP